MKHKLLSILLCLAMALSLLPTAALADETAKPVKVGETGFETLEAAIAAAEPVNGVITYEITGKVNVTAAGWVQVAKAGLTGLTKVAFVGNSDDAEICIVENAGLLADQSYDIDVSFANLTLSKKSPGWVGDMGHAANYFTCWLRNENQAENTVTYTNCTFPNGACNNQYGKTVFDNCKFTNDTNGLYNLWNYGGNTEVKNSSFTGVRGIKTYNEGTLQVAPKVTVTDTTFDGLSEKAAIVASKATGITLTNVSATNCTKGLLQKDIENSGETTTIEANGTGISGDFKITADRGTEAAKAEFNISAGTFSPVSEGGTVNITDYLASGANFDATTGEVKMSYVAKIGNTEYPTLAAAVAAAEDGDTITLLKNTRENVTISKKLTLDLNGCTLNGGTEKGKPALTVTNSVTVKDSSVPSTGTIMREDTDSLEVTGSQSHYVIDIQGKNGFLKFEGGNVVNTSGIPGVKGASLVRLGNDSVAGAYPTLTITGGTFTQDNFIAIKVDRGTLHFNGGEVNSANSYAIENWNNAFIKGGTVNGTVSSWVYSTGAAFSKLEISGGKVNGNVASVNYDSAADKQARIFITGGEVTGTLGTYTYNNGLVPTDETAMATVEVTGGTFNSDPTKYVVEDSAVIKNADGKFGVEKAYLAKVGDTSYYTMDEAFKAQTASGKAIVMLRDYTTNAIFNSGSIDRTVDLNGFKWTYTGTDADSAAFEINYSDVTLTVKNGTIVSSQLVGLIPSAMGGTIKYDNAGLVFENVEATANGHSGIETNGNNTNDSVTLKDSTLNVPNGYGIYFPSSGTLTIDNSTINAKTMGVQVCAGSLSINRGSEITVTGDPVEKTEGDGAIEDGAAVSIVNRTGYKDLGDITITGGTFTAKPGNDAVKAYDWKNNSESTFSEDTKVSVSGGTFSSAVDPKYCADGFVPTKNADGTYGVTRPSSGSSGSSSSDPTYAVSTPSKTENGTVTVSPKNASKGDTVTITVKPDSGYVLDDLTVTDKNGNELTLKDKGSGKYTFTMPAGKVEVNAIFAEEIETSPFADVATDAYYYEAVKWAVKNGITDGVGNNLFAPGQPCTRAQIVTFLWRAAGSPEPKGTAAGMTDVVSGSYYEKAVAWAIENGVTTGTTATTFSPDATCTRAQAVTFLARALNAKASGKAEFADVPTDSYFAEAVAWAASNGVTEGVGNGLFAPDNDCTRGQIVTFLYRAYNK